MNRGQWINFVQAYPFVTPALRRRLLARINVKSHEEAVVYAGSFFGGGRVVLGKRVFVNLNCFFDGQAPIRIGDWTRVGPFVRFVTSTHGIRDTPVRIHPGDPTEGKPVTVGRGCWIGAGATLLPGAAVGDGCVIAAGAVVTGATEPHSVYGGVPARKIRDLPIVVDGVDRRAAQEEAATAAAVPAPADGAVLDARDRADGAERPATVDLT